MHNFKLSHLVEINSKTSEYSEPHNLKYSLRIIFRLFDFSHQWNRLTQRSLMSKLVLEKVFATFIAAL